jgi:hypothetical protein
VLAAYGLLAALRDDTSAVLDVAKFPADGKNRTALLSAQGLPGDTVVDFRWSSLKERHGSRFEAGSSMSLFVLVPGWLLGVPGWRSGSRWSARRRQPRTYDLDGEWLAPADHG